MNAELLNDYENEEIENDAQNEYQNEENMISEENYLNDEEEVENDDAETNDYPSLKWAILTFNSYLKDLKLFSINLLQTKTGRLFNQYAKKQICEIWDPSKW